jgi:hypothetical protein
MGVCEFHQEPSVSTYTHSTSPFSIRVLGARKMTPSPNRPILSDTNSDTFECLLVNDYSTARAQVRPPPPSPPFRPQYDPLTFLPEFCLSLLVFETSTAGKLLFPRSSMVLHHLLILAWPAVLQRSEVMTAALCKVNGPCHRG